MKIYIAGDPWIESPSSGKDLDVVARDFFVANGIQFFRLVSFFYSKPVERNINLKKLEKEEKK